MLEFDTFTLSNSLLCSISINFVLIISSFCVGDILIEFIQDVSKGFYIILKFFIIIYPIIFHLLYMTVKEQPVQEYLTDSSGILGQINLET